VAFLLAASESLAAAQHRLRFFCHIAGGFCNQDIKKPKFLFTEVSQNDRSVAEKI
jgi:hypothetical protein